MADARTKEAEQQLRAGFDTYDQHVDVVCAFEWVFTDTTLVQPMHATVTHFERFPRVTTPDGTVLTPDFTVLFTDQTAIIGEIAKIAVREESVDRLCDQIGKYAAVTAVPGPDGAPVPVTRVDVMQLVDMTTGMSAFRRIVKDRYENPAHPYNPPSPPCVVQFTRTESKYVFQRIPDPANGTLDPGGRTPHIQHYLDNDFGTPVARFAPIKVRRAFINDAVDPLYLATHLWTRTWPTVFGPGTDEITVRPNDTAETLREQYGTGRATDVRKAFDLLAKAGLAGANSDGSWTIARKQLGRAGNRGDVHRLIAARVAGGVKPLLARRARVRAVPEGTMDPLFDL